MEGSIDPRCEKIRGTHWPVEVAGVFGTRVAENHLGQRSTNRTNRPDIWMQAIRSDHQKTLAARGPSTYGSRRSGRRNYSTPLPTLFDFGRPCARRPASARLPRQSANSFHVMLWSRPAESFQLSPLLESTTRRSE